jgi:hypothetical protein
MPINPYKITQEKLPLIVLSTLSSGFIAMWIRWFTKASYSHAMSMINPGEFASQGNTFSQAPLWRYVKKNGRLKFWKIKDLKNWERNKIMSRVNKRLRLPYWKRMYDYLGIFGQATKLRFINNPWKPYCSEQVKYDCLDGIIDLAVLDKNGKIVKLPKHPSPKDLNEFFKIHPRMEVYGRWAGD